MLIRKRFVTNSSTSSYLIYGVGVTNDEVSKVLELAIKAATPEKLKAAAKAYGNENEDLTNPENWKAMIEDLDSYDTSELVSMLLPGLKFMCSYEWGHADNYLYIDKSLGTVCDGLKVSFTDITPDDYDQLLNLAKAANLEDQNIGFDHWASSDY
jgi:hypothetical protein